MNVFGSREGDPLLQDDPFAPSDEKERASDASAPSTDASEQTEEPDGQSAEQRTEESDTVFGRASAADEATRVVVRSAEEAAQGRLAELNAAFDQGRRLARVDLRAGEGSGQTSKAEPLIAFVLRDGNPET